MAVGKRKRETLPDEVEVDITAPEPPSKKELRRLKKGKPANHKPANSDDEADPVVKAARKALSKNLAAHKQLDQAFQDAASDAGSDSARVKEAEPESEDDEDDESEGEQASAAAKSKPDGPVEDVRRDAPGVWVGNLPWTVTKTELLKFVTDHGRVLPSDITRVHMPGPTAHASGQIRHKKLSNRGFAYIDFKTEEARDLVIKLSEMLLAGRAVLIKNSKSYEGRPAQDAKKITDSNGKPPSTRIFVGNLGFDATEDDLRDHYAKCGQVKSVFIATFPDSGNCKGYGWVTFDEIVSAEKAIRGWVELDPEDVPEDDEDDGDKSGDKDTEAAEDGDSEQEAKSAAKARKERRKKKSKPRKWYVNRLKGRELRTEFAEDATTRYVKRFGKKKEESGPISAADGITPPKDYKPSDDHRDKKPRTSEGMKRAERPTTEARPPRPQSRPAKLEDDKGKAYLTGAVMAGKGKKITF